MAFFRCFFPMSITTTRGLPSAATVAFWFGVRFAVAVLSVISFFSPYARSRSQVCRSRAVERSKGTAPPAPDASIISQHGTEALAGDLRPPGSDLAQDLAALVHGLQAIPQAVREPLVLLLPSCLAVAAN